MTLTQLKSIYRQSMTTQVNSENITLCENKLDAKVQEMSTIGKTTEMESKRPVSRNRGEEAMKYAYQRYKVSLGR